ncbi:hypothetical protein EJ110_NYTH00024 [Nymphaea thermarum]|nr:hypothetical protein EJ110_NYTH00024 [Nymphaea thermarum]
MVIRGAPLSSDRALSLDAHVGEPLVICCADEGLIIVKIMVHRTSYRSLGYGFIKFAKETDAESALENMQGQQCKSRDHTHEKNAIDERET